MSIDFGKLVREARERRGLSQEQLAELVGATQSTIDRIESGVTRRSGYMHHIAVELNLIEYAAGRPIKAASKNDDFGLKEKVLKLPTDVIERVRKFGIEYGMASEEEAFRRIIDEGLMQFDHAVSITDRLHKRFKEKGSLKEAARFILGKHPKVVSVVYADNKISFELDDSYTVEMNNKGIATIMDQYGEFFEFSVGDEPEWAAPENLDPPQYKLGASSNK